MKFWISRRVPQRDIIVDKIQSNSGTVVILEKDADMLIADHARKDAPLGSYSWKFIIESVNAGIVQVEDKYLIGPAPGQPRSVLAGPHAKKTRTPFTELDDAIVAKQYPHHPWQSWRNRWTKILSLKPNEEIDRLAKMAKLDVDNASITARHIIRKHEREDWPGRSQPPQQADTVASTSNENSRRQAEPSPRVVRRDAAQYQELAPSENFDRRITTDEVASEPSGDTTEEDTTIYHDVATGEEPSVTRDSETGREEEREAQEREQEEDTEADQGGDQEEENGGNIDENEEEDTEDYVSVDGGLSSFTERDQFFSDLQDYCEANDKRLVTQCVIGNTEIDLWELFQAVSAQSLPPDELDWKRVAEHMGLTWAQNKEVVVALLRSNYDRHLAGFVEAVLSFEEKEEILDEDDEEGDDTVVWNGETTAEPTTPRASQRSGVTPSRSGSGKPKSRKRLSDGQSLAPENQSKRRRTIHTEIPVTPEGKERTRRRLSAPASAPGHLAGAVDHERAEIEDPRQRILKRNVQRQQSPEEPADNTPSQQLRSETESIASPEPIEPGTPTLYFNPTSTSRYHWNDRHLETIQEEESAASTPTKTRSRKRALPASFQQPDTMHPHERRERKRLQEQEQRRYQQLRQQQRQQQWVEGRQLEDQRQEESLQEEQIPEEQRQREEEQEKEQQLPRQRQEDAADSGEADDDVNEQSDQEFLKWEKHYSEMGYSSDMIIEAMRRTTMTPGILMEVVLESLSKGEGIPAYDEGIWTDRDDSQLRYIDRIGDLELTLEDSSDWRRRKGKAQKMLDRLLYKHTEPGVKLRKKFLRALTVAERKQDREGRREEGGER
ncbi:hypothetical protein ACHAQJ_008266 [Trichoderma viride]